MGKYNEEFTLSSALLLELNKACLTLVKGWVKYINFYLINLNFWWLHGHSHVILLMNDIEVFFFLQCFPTSHPVQYAARFSQITSHPNSRKAGSYLVSKYKQCVWCSHMAPMSCNKSCNKNPFMGQKSSLYQKYKNFFI